MKALVVLGIYFILAIAIPKIVWRMPSVKANTSRSRWIKSIVVALFFGPSLLVSVHAVLPLPTILAFAANLGGNNALSIFEVFQIFIGSLVVSSILLFGIFTLKYNSGDK